MASKKRHGGTVGRGLYLVQKTGDCETRVSWLLGRHPLLGCAPAHDQKRPASHGAENPVPFCIQDIAFPCDIMMLLGLHSIWRCRMAVRHADLDVEYALYGVSSLNMLACSQQCIKKKFSGCRMVDNIWEVGVAQRLKLALCRRTTNGVSF